VIQVIVYSVATGFPRRILETGKESMTQAEANALANVQPGEAASIYPKNPPRADGKPANALPHWIDHITQLRGAPPSGYRHVELDAEGKVVSVHHADPACGDKPQNGGVKLVPHESAAVGWKLTGDTWEPAK
jgi:hypothetical protein